MNKQRGVLIISHGDRKYLMQARTLILSIRQHNPHLPIAVATDSPEYFDSHKNSKLISSRFHSDSPLLSKLRMYELSPFDKTLFIDSDALVVGDICPVFDVFDGRAFSPFTGKSSSYTTPNWFNDLSRIEDITGTDGLPGFNGGIYYFEKPKAEVVFTRARSLADRYEDLSLRRAGPAGNKNEEPLLSIAMALEGMEGVGRKEAGMDIMWAPAGKKGKIEIDAIDGQCRFNKDGLQVEPVIMHFATDDHSYPYKREQYRLEALHKNGALTPMREKLIEIRARWHHFTHHFLPIWSRIFKNKIEDIWNE